MRSAKIVVVLGIIALCIGLGYYAFGSLQRKNTPVSSFTPTPEEKADITLEIHASNNTFQPAEIRKPLSKSLRINVTAVDRDYTLKVNGYPRLDATFVKGKTTSLFISGLGVGEYIYNCGPSCTGKLIVEQEAD